MERFGQERDTIEWKEFRDDALFFKWPAAEIKKGTQLLLRPGQKAVFFADGRVEGVLEQPGSFDVLTDILPSLSTRKGQLRGDAGLRAAVYFLNAKELLLPWGTRQRVMLPTPETPSGIPLGCNGNLIVEFRDYLAFIKNAAEKNATYALGDISERLMGELSPIIAACILDRGPTVELKTLIDLQADSRALSKKLAAELDKELAELGLGVRDLNILSINYPGEVQAMAERAAGRTERSAAPVSAGEGFCPVCRKAVGSKFCPDCGTAVVW